MTILQITANPTGLSGVSPRLVYIQTNDTAATVATVGYLNNAVREGFTFQPGDMCLVSTTATGNLVNSISNYYQAVFTSPNWSLVADVNPGSVLLPVVVGRIATFTNVLGQVGDQAVIATHQGSIQAGSTTAQGSFLSFGAANAGALDHLTLSYVTSAGNRGLTITNAAMGQATTITMPDPGVAAANYLLTQAGVGQTIGTGFLAITSGLLTVGSTGHAGTIGLVPTTAANGQFILSATNTGAGNFNATLTNSAMGQSTVFSVPDPGVAAASFLLTQSAGTQTIATGGLTISNGQLTSGSVGAAGELLLIPTTAANGNFILIATNAGANFNTVLTNGVMGQSTIYTIPDAGNALARVLVAATATPFTTGHLLQSSGTGGLVTDSGVATANIQQKSQVLANSTNAGGSGAGPVAVAVAGVTSASKIVASLASSSNAVQIQTVLPTNTGFSITFTGDPGASAIVDYVIYIVAQ